MAAEHKHDHQQMALQLQMLDQHVERLNQQFAQATEHEESLDTTIDALSQLDQVAANSVSLVQVANGIFVKGTVTAPNTLLVNVGAGVMVEKSREELLEHVETQKNSIITMKIELDKRRNELAAQAEAIRRHLGEHHV